jgi:uncharacterized membrane protein YoaK (UPF0700 family)
VSDQPTVHHEQAVPRVGPWSSLAADPVHGPLPMLLLVLTMMTGVIDAVSILGLGRVFVANMTGNIVFIGFALARAPGFSLAASLAALLGFLVGAYGGGVFVEKFAAHRGRLIRNTCSVQFAIVAVALVVAATSGKELGGASRVAIAALCAAAMGMQNTMARGLAVPDLTTTVLTMTLTGIAADSRRSHSMTNVRRALSVLCMFAGAVIGALLFLHTRLVWPLALVLVLLGVVVGVSAWRSRRPAPWQVPS